MINIKETIKAKREDVSQKIDVDKEKVKQIYVLLNQILKKIYSSSSYYIDNEVSTFIKINDSDLSIESLTSKGSHFFGKDRVNVFGVEVNKFEDSYSYVSYNMVENIPFEQNEKIFNNKSSNTADQVLYDVKTLINEVNQDIRVELDKILRKEEKYKGIIEKAIFSKKMNSKALSIFNENLENSEIIKKTSKKLEEYFSIKALKIEASYLSVDYTSVSFGIMAIVEEYNSYERFNMKKNSFFLGCLQIDIEKNSNTFEPSFKNQKYFSKKISSIRYMRDSFKKMLLKYGLEK